MSEVTNANILAELWTEGKASVFNAKQLLKNIKATTKVKSTKKNPDGIKLGEATFLMPEEFIGTSLPDAWGGKDNMWLLIKVDNSDWDGKRNELEEKNK
ncbi:hypothetical protein [Bacillus sp. T33-2]|uniref:hypothetical protein n=1 Tax=Bacillus sp. T33-2 TaxID=2054168 RepID=UPI000C778CFF|nr:hypothetical protein [Bacillus sp. T33-2]PLR99510.1 hypothetical protein CVD19_00170 [Bacillus sp. T33-2]